MSYEEYEKLAFELHEHIRNPNPEYITCAAIWYKDVEGTHGMRPVNLEKGIVVCGRRHGDVIQTVSTLAHLRTVQFGERAIGDHEEGFLTSRNRFLDRKEAGELAFKIGQVKHTTDCLFSEDLY